MGGGGGMWVRSDVTSGHNRRWEWRPDAGDAEDGKTTSDASGRGARASDAGLIFADALELGRASLESARLGVMNSVNLDGRVCPSPKVDNIQ